MVEPIFPAGTPLGIGKSPLPFARVEGSKAEAALEEMRITHQDKTPVILGDEEEASRLFEFEYDPSAPVPADTIAKSNAADGRTLLTRHREEFSRRIAELYKERNQPNPFEGLDEPAPSRGDWPEFAEQQQGLISLIDFRTGGVKKEVLIGLVPTSKPWEIPAYLKFGGWNDCPPPEIHVAFARDWFEQFGARVVLNAADTIEFSVEKPASSREDALALAMQQYAYCSDIVEQGVGTVDALAAGLMGARYWYFWWD